MTKSLLFSAIGSGFAQDGCMDSWCPVSRNVVDLQLTLANLNYTGCRDFCLLNVGSGCQAFTLEPVHSQAGVCTHYKYDKSASLKDVFAYFPEVNLSKVFPDTVYTSKQVGAPTTVSGRDQCLTDLSGASSVGAKYATYGNQACGKKSTHTVSIVDGAYVETERQLTFKYTPASVGLGGAPEGYLTLTDTGFSLSPNPVHPGSYWTWSYGGVEQSSNGEPVCMGVLHLQDPYLAPIYVNNGAKSRCKMGMHGGSPKSPFGWVMKDTTVETKFKCMGDVKPDASGDYNVISIEDPTDGLCNTAWEVGNGVITGETGLFSRQCDAAAFDGAWVDGQLYPPGDFSPQWFDKLTISSVDNQVLAHTTEGDANVSYSISIDGCSITMYLKKDCALCKAIGTMSEDRERINWDSGFNDGDYWIRKNANAGCCTVFDATVKTPSSLTLPSPGRTISSTDAACAARFTGRWVDTHQGDFNSTVWVPYMYLSADRPEDEVEDDTNGRMTAPIEQGSWVLPVKFYSEGGICKVKLCFEKQCVGEAYAIGALEADEIVWDERLNNGTWDRQASSNVFCNYAVSRYSCCNSRHKVGCSFAPNKEVCKQHGGQFCCDPSNASDLCGLEPTTTSTTLMLV